MAPWAKYLGDEGAPFIWDEERRFLMRAELDAAYFHLYGIKRQDLDLVMDSFRAFRNKKPELFERTKKEITRVYEEMASGAPYVTPLTPPPGAGPRHAPGTSPLTRVAPASRPTPTVSVPPQPKKAVPVRRAKKVSEVDQLGGGLFGLDEVEGVDIQLDIFSSGDE